MSDVTEALGAGEELRTEMERHCPWPLESDYGKRWALGYSKARAVLIGELLPVIERLAMSRASQPVEPPLDSEAVERVSRAIRAEYIRDPFGLRLAHRLARAALTAMDPVAKPVGGGE